MLIAPIIEEGAVLALSPSDEVGAKLAPSEGAVLAPSPGAESAPYNRPGNISINKTSRARVRAEARDDDGQEKTNDEKPTNVSPIRRLREPNDLEREVLETCLEWERGVSVPLAAHLVELYRTMRPVYDLRSLIPTQTCTDISIPACC
jgi:hypothetical protein